MITDRDRPLRYLLVLLFVVYFLLIPVWVVFFKADPSIFFSQYWERKQFADTELLLNFSGYANLNPFNILIGDMVLNVIAFVPFGVYLEMLYHKNTVISKVMVIFFTSLFIEVLQFSLLFGSTDIVDLISNTLGGVIGILAMRKIHKDKTVKIILVLAIITTLIITIAVGIHTVNRYYSISDYYNSEAYQIYLDKVQQLSGME